MSELRFWALEPYPLLLTALLLSRVVGPLLLLLLPLLPLSLFSMPLLSRLARLPLSVLVVLDWKLPELDISD